MNKFWSKSVLILLLLGCINLSNADLNRKDNISPQSREDISNSRNTEEEVEIPGEAEGEIENSMNKLYTMVIDRLYQTWAEFVEFTEIITKVGSILAILIIVLISTILGYFLGKKIGKSSTKYEDLITNLNKWFKQLFLEIDKIQHLEKRYKRISQFFYIMVFLVLAILFVIIYYSFYYTIPYFLWTLGITIVFMILFILLGKLFKRKSKQKAEQKNKKQEGVEMLVNQLDPELLKKMTEVMHYNRARDAVSDEGCSKRCKILVQYHQEDVKRHQEVFQHITNFVWCGPCNEGRKNTDGLFEPCQSGCAPKFIFNMKQAINKFSETKGTVLDPLKHKADQMKKELEEKVLKTKSIFKDYMKTVTEGESIKSIISKASSEKKDI